MYLKRQEDLLYGAEKKKYGFVPRLLTKCFEKIMTIKKKYNLSNNDIYNVIINRNFKWDSEYESILISLKRSLNKNVWNLFDEIENLIFIKVLLFDWFEDCVIYAISPTRVEHIITSKTYKACLVDNGIIDSQKINELFNIIKSELNIYEYEIIFQVAAFAALIPVENGIDSKDLFIDMLDRISFGLMGFALGKKEVVEDKHVQELVTGLTSIINLIYESLIISLSPIKNISKLELRSYEGKTISSIRTIKMISPSRNRSSIFYSQIPTVKVNGLLTEQPKEEAESPQEEQPNFIRKIRRSVYMHINNTIKEKESEVGSNSLRSDKNEKVNKKSILKEIYKDELDKTATVKQLNTWLKEDFGAFNIEVHYSQIKHHCITCEAFLGERITDYKFFCFHGEPKFIYVSNDLIHDRQAQIGFFYLDGSKMPLKRADYTDIASIELPSFFGEMLEMARTLCADFPFVRVDFFLANNSYYFAELTFTPSACMMPFNPDKYDLAWGKMLDISAIKE